MSLSKKFESIKFKHRLTLERFGEIAGCSGETIRQIISGQNQDPRRSIIENTAKHFGLNVDWFFSDENDESLSPSNLGEAMDMPLANNSNNITLFELKIQELTIVKNNLKRELVEKDKVIAEKDKLLAEKDLINAELRLDKKMLIEDKERLLSQLGNKREQA